MTNELALCARHTFHLSSKVSLLFKSHCLFRLMINAFSLCNKQINKQQQKRRDSLPICSICVVMLCISLIWVSGCLYALFGKDGPASTALRSVWYACVYRRVCIKKTVHIPSTLLRFRTKDERVLQSSGYLTNR